MKLGVWVFSYFVLCKHIGSHLKVCSSDFLVSFPGHRLHLTWTSLTTSALAFLAIPIFHFAYLSSWNLFNCFKSENPRKGFLFNFSLSNLLISSALGFSTLLSFAPDWKWLGWDHEANCLQSIDFHFEQSSLEFFILDFNIPSHFNFQFEMLKCLMKGKWVFRVFSPSLLSLHFSRELELFQSCVTYEVEEKTIMFQFPFQPSVSASRFCLMLSYSIVTGALGECVLLMCEGKLSERV